MTLKSIKQVADSWGVSVYTVRRLAAAGMVNTVTLGRRRLISEAEIARIVAAGVPRTALQGSTTPEKDRSGNK
jgi:excisionase family DNA binding protein